MKRVIAMGGGKRAARTLEAIISDKQVEIVAVIGMLGYPDEEAYCLQAEVVAKKSNIEFFKCQNITDAIHKKVISLEADAIIGIGVWRSILSENFLNATRIGFLAVHGTGLPKYRGWAGINWQIINGEKFINMHAYKLGLGVDDGDLIINQHDNLPIRDTIAIANDKHLKEIFEEYEDKHIKLIRTILKALSMDAIEFTVQDHTIATYGCHRGPDDGEINWSDETYKIFNFIRGQSRPYSGAFTYFNGKRIWIHRAKRRNEFKNYAGRIFGKVVHRDLDTGSVIILTKDSAVEILEAEVQIDSELRPVVPCDVFSTVRSRCKSRVETYLDLINV